jgi:histidinol-phosphate phosphatase family protein
VMLAVDLASMAERHLGHGADFTLFAHPNDHPHDSDLLECDTDGWVTAIHSYPHAGDRPLGNLVNAALYVARRDALRPWQGTVGKLDFTADVVPGLLASGGRVLAHRSTEYIKDMGTPERLARVEADFKSGRIDLAASRRPAPAVFLDRDGTLNRDTGFLARQEELELLPGAADALAALRRAGYRLVVLTNQPVIARGEASEDDVQDIHRRLEWELGKKGAFVDAIYVCPHHPDSGFTGERPELKFACECRKPATGLFDAACRDLNLDPARSWMIGDQTADIELARRAGIRAILVQTGAAGRDGKYAVHPDHQASDVAAAARLIVEAGA